MSKFSKFLTRDIFPDHMVVVMSTDIGSRFISAIPTSLIIGLKVKVMDLELFYVKVLNSSYFPDHMMDLVYTLYDDKYRSKCYSAIPPPHK